MCAASERVGGDQISNLLTEWNRADRENSTLNSNPTRAACPPVILCTKTDEARVRIVTPIIGSTTARWENLLDAFHYESYRVRTVRVHWRPPARDLRCCRLFVFFATIVRDDLLERHAPLFFFPTRSARRDIFSARLAFVEDSNEDKLIPRSPIFLSLFYFSSFFHFQRASEKSTTSIPAIWIYSPLRNWRRAIVERMNFIVMFFQRCRVGENLRRNEWNIRDALSIVSSVPRISREYRWNFPSCLG